MFVFEGVWRLITVDYGSCNTQRRQLVVFMEELKRVCVWGCLMAIHHWIIVARGSVSRQMEEEIQCGCCGGVWRLFTLDYHSGRLLLVMSVEEVRECGSCVWSLYACCHRHATEQEVALAGFLWILREPPPPWLSSPPPSSSEACQRKTLWGSWQIWSWHAPH